MNMLWDFKGGVRLCAFKLTHYTSLEFIFNSSFQTLKTIMI